MKGTHMAWNPSPEVQVARDAAKKLGDIMRTQVDRCVVIFTTADGKLGYASFGATAALCAEARKMGDAAFSEVNRKWEVISPE